MCSVMSFRNVYVFIVYNFPGASVLNTALPCWRPVLASVFIASIFPCFDDQKPLSHPIKLSLFISGFFFFTEDSIKFSI